MNTGRTVTLALVDPSGVYLGTLPPFEIPTQWWPEATEIVDAVRERYGAEVTVLRLLHTEPGRRHGGRVTYLASADKPIPDATAAAFDAPASVGAGPRAFEAPPSLAAELLGPGDAGPGANGPDLADHPLRGPWARPGGPEQILAWAAETMAAIGRPVRCAQQLRTWNLSAIWRLDTAAGPTWLKVVPPFFAHEGAVLSWLHRALPGRAPVPLVAEPGRVIMDRVSGDDRYDATVVERLVMVVNLVEIQAEALHAVEELRAHGVPSLDLADLKTAAADVIDRRGGEASRRAVGEPPADALAALAALVDGLGPRIAAIDACGLPTTLVHGDFHPGNVRGDVILDWGDSVLSHPGFDLLRTSEGLDPSDARVLEEVWSRRWREVVPGCEPERAVDLLRPLADLRNAVMYAGFLDNIEPSEWPYHDQDVLPPLIAAAGLPGARA